MLSEVKGKVSKQLTSIWGFNKSFNKDRYYTNYRIIDLQALDDNVLLLSSITSISLAINSLSQMYLQSCHPQFETNVLAGGNATKLLQSE